MAEYPRIITFEEKYGNRYFIANNKEEYHKIFEKILKERINEGYWYDDEEMASLKEDKKDKKFSAFSFLSSRSGGEYEGFSIEYPEKF